LEEINKQMQKRQVQAKQVEDGLKRKKEEK